MKPMQSTISKPPDCITIAGFDPSGGAGVLADVRTFSAFECFATAAITSITFQNYASVYGALHQTGDSVKRQVEAITDSRDVRAVKIGMLPTREVVEAVAELIKGLQLKNVVVDPVIRSTSGYDLIDSEALAAMTELIFPWAELITPNIPETEEITGVSINSPDDMRHAVRLMQAMGAKNVLVKGGHAFEGKRQKAKGKSKKATDHLFTGDDIEVYEAEFIDGPNVRGTGCMLSSAIAANLALGRGMSQAVQAAKDFVTEAIRAAS